MQNKNTLNRRRFLGGVTALSAGLLTGCGSTAPNQPPASQNQNPPTTNSNGGGTKTPTPNPQPNPTPSTSTRSKVYVLSTDDRKQGIQDILKMFGLAFAKDRKILVKPNLVSGDPYPTTTHDDTLRTLIPALKEAGSKGITIGESAGLGRTKSVISDKNTLALCKELDVPFVNFDDLPADGWESFAFEGMHWGGSLAIPKLLRDDHAVVLLPSCKTHNNSSAIFTMSLKLAVGITPVTRRGALHSAGNISAWSADINRGFTPDLVLMDALQSMISGGPISGQLVTTNLMVASHDRVALDAVGLAILKHAGTKVPALQKKIFEQTQIKRAVEIGLGAKDPDHIELVSDSDKTTKPLQAILDIG